MLSQPMVASGKNNDARGRKKYKQQPTLQHGQAILPKGASEWQENQPK